MSDFYQHYKGAIYQVIAKGVHTETGEELTIYKDKDNRVWVRPTKMFLEKVIVNGLEVDRFKYMGTFD